VISKLISDLIPENTFKINSKRAAKFCAIAATVFLTVAPVIFTAGCTTVGEKPVTVSPKKEEPEPVKVEISAPEPPAEDMIDEEIPELPSIEIKTPQQEYESKHYDFDLQSGNITEVLRALVKGTDIGLVIDPGISSTQIPIMDLKNATLKEILSYILPPLNLEYRWEGKNLHVFRAPLVTRYFNLNYLSSTRKGKRQVSFSTRSGGSTGSGGGGVSGGSVTSGGTMGGGGTGGAGASGQNQSTNEITTEYENSIWNTFIDSLKVLVFGALRIETGGQSSSGGGDSREKIKSFAYADPSGKQLLISPETGIVVVTAFEDEVNKVSEFIEKYEGSSQRQVWIEAKILEVNLNKAYQMGIDWGAVTDTKYYYGILNSKRTLYRPGIQFTPGDVETQAVSESGSGAFQFAVSNDLIDVMLDAIARQGNLKVLASPRLSTLNNEKAVIRVVREEAFFNLQTQISQGIGGNVSAPTINVQVVPIGIVMDILPQISEDGDILLSVNPDISELLEIRRFEVSGALATQPVIDRRSIDTTAKLKDHQTLVIAGIIKERKNEILKGVPLFYKLPLVGNLFRRTEQELVRTELVIFITPSVHAGKTAEQLTEAEKERIKNAIIPGRLGDTFRIEEGIKGEVSSLKKKKN
jgi:MSHA biogenesis protein MshL